MTTLVEELEAAADIISYHAGSSRAMSDYYDYPASAARLRARAAVVREETERHILNPWLSVGFCLFTAFVLVMGVLVGGRRR